MKREKGKYQRLALFSMAGLFLLGAAAKQNANETILIPLGVLALLYLPYFIADWCLGRKKDEAPTKEEPPFKPFKVKNTRTRDIPIWNGPVQATPKPVKAVNNPAPAPPKRTPCQELLDSMSTIPKVVKRGLNIMRREGSRLILYSEGPHGDRVELFVKSGCVRLNAGNDGYPNPGGGGGVEVWLPEALVEHYDPAAMVELIHKLCPWMSYITADKLTADEVTVNAYFRRLIKARQDDAGTYSDGWYQYTYQWNTGDIYVGHRPTDRMASDPEEGYYLTRAELRGMRKADFCDRFARDSLQCYPPDPERIRERSEALAAWLDSIGAEFKPE